MREALILRVVVASPNDVKAERNALDAIVKELNRGIAADRGLRLEITRWEEDSYAAFHVNGPQGLIDAILRIEDCDIFIGIFWKRFGTPVKDAKSGTEHEFRLAYESWKQYGRPQIMFYFNQKPYTPKSTEEAYQWGQVLEFKAGFPKSGFWWEYMGKSNFIELVRNHLTQLIRKQFPIHTPAVINSDDRLAQKKAKEEQGNSKGLSYDSIDNYPAVSRTDNQGLGNLPVGRHAPGYAKKWPPLETATPRRAVIFLGIIALLLIFVIIGWRYITEKDKAEMKKPQERTLGYWGELQRYQDNKPVGNLMRLTGGVTGETYFSTGDGIRFIFTLSDAGYFYLINEERQASNASPSFRIVFPSPAANNASSEIKAGQQVKTSELMFDENTGNEELWIIWSTDRIEELEQAISRWVNQNDEGMIQDPVKAEFVRNLLSQTARTKVRIERDDVNDKMTIKGIDNPMIYSLKLIHRE